MPSSTDPQIPSAFPRRRHLNERGKIKRAYQSYLDLMSTGEWLQDLLSGQLANFELSMLEYRVLERIWRRGPQYQQNLSRKFKCTKQNVGWVIKRLEHLGRVVRIPARIKAETANEDRAKPKKIPIINPEGATPEEAAHIERNHVGRGGWQTRERNQRLAAYIRQKQRDQSETEIEVDADLDEFGRGNPEKPLRPGRPVLLVQLTKDGRALIEKVFAKHAKYVKSLMRVLEGREQETLSRLCQKLRRGDVVKFFKEIRLMECNYAGPDRGY